MSHSDKPLSTCELTVSSLTCLKHRSIKKVGQVLPERAIVGQLSLHLLMEVVGSMSRPATIVGSLLDKS